ncbi:MAG: beta-propeller domain-containing protein [Acidimicrobiia bacterium]
MPRPITLLVVLALLLTACSGAQAVDDRNLTGPERRSQTGSARGRAVSSALVPFDACESFLDYVISHGVELVGPYGLDPFFGGPFFARAEDAATTMAAEASGSDAGGEMAHSGTNVQVLGVDEPDMVKTDGERIVVLSEGTLIVADVTGPEPEVVGRLQVGDFSVQNLFLSGDTVLLFGSVWGPIIPLAESDSRIAPVPESPKVQLIEVDISGEPEIVRTMNVDGRFVSARMVGDTVRLVLSSGPVGLEWSFPNGSGLRAERDAVEANREIIRNSDVDNWIPFYVVADAGGEVTAEGTLFDCERANHPEEFSGLDMLSVVTIDVGSGLDVVDATGVLATGETVYASAESLYVATQSWQVWQWGRTGVVEDRPEEISTEIHKFDISSDTAATYRATGEVPGYLLNQFAMDEHDGLLRVASTTSPTWWGSGFESESQVTVLEEDDGELVKIGMVDGLGKGEQIYSVRFIDDAAYVVTFRQTDPLYTIDLADPTSPRVVGELKILGYSAYLHPVGDGLLLGIGQDATDTGQIKGTQVSVFDVGDPADPKRVDQFTLSEGSSSQVEYDHHAFLYWEQTGLAMVPVQQWSWDGKNESVFLGAVGLTVDDGGTLGEIDRLVHPGGEDKYGDYRAQIMRSLVIGDRVYTVSAKGIMSSALDTLQEESWLEF